MEVVAWVACCCRKYVVRHRPSPSASLLAVCWLGVLGKVAVWFFALRLAGFVAILFGNRGCAFTFKQSGLFFCFAAVGFVVLQSVCVAWLWVLPAVAGGFGLLTVGCCQSGGSGAFPVVRQCGTAGCSGSNILICPTSQSKGLPAVPAGKVFVFHR